MTPANFIGGVECRSGVVMLPISEEALGALTNAGQGALWFNSCEIREGAAFICAWYSDHSILVAFHAEVRMPMGSRRFAVAPTHFPFVRPSDVEVRPLCGVGVPTTDSTVLFTLYEVFDVVRAEMQN
jgi:hypothetical protein